VYARSVRPECERMFVMQPVFEPRLCGRCGQVKPAIAFAWRRRHRLQRDTYCRPCRSTYGKEHYRANKQRYIDLSQATKERTRIVRTQYLIEFFESHPCQDCGQTDPVVLEFDHRGDKLFDIGAGLISRKWKSVLQEMEKCDVVCANCHRRRTARRRGSVRLALSSATSGGRD